MNEEQYPTLLPHYWTEATPHEQDCLLALYGGENVMLYAQEQEAH